MKGSRVLEPEWLDELPPAAPEAQASRRDLRRVNFFMGNASIVARAFRQANAQRWATHLVEIGSGDGAFFRRVWEKIEGGNKVRNVTLLDRQDCFDAETVRALTKEGLRIETVVCDVFDWVNEAPASSTFVFANLFLHHFSDEQLRGLFERISQGCGAFIGCEPRRIEPATMIGPLLWLIGCNHVTRHDGFLSVRAGFAGKELSALWPGDASWRLQEGRAAIFSHLFCATRRNV